MRGDYEERREGGLGKRGMRKEKETGRAGRRRRRRRQAVQPAPSRPKRRGQRHRIAGRWASTHLPKTTSSPPSPPPMPPFGFSESLDNWSIDRHLTVCRTIDGISIYPFNILLLTNALFQDLTNPTKQLTLVYRSTTFRKTSKGVLPFKAAFDRPFRIKNLRVRWSEFTLFP